MAGVRPTPSGKGRYIGWYIDAAGRQRSLTGTTKKRETLDIMQRLEDEARLVKHGVHAAPGSAERCRHRAIGETVTEYVEHGKLSGGRRGLPWAKEHARTRTSDLRWWTEKLNLKTLADLDAILPKVEALLRDMKAEGRAGKTLRNVAESLRAFCRWATDRGYLAGDPLAHLGTIDGTPRTQRRPLTDEEVGRLLAVAPPVRALVYRVALTSGLRANELRNLTVRCLDRERGGLWLDGAWTKNRKPGFQPLPAVMVDELARAAEGKPSDARLLAVAEHMDDHYQTDREAAKIPRYTPEGKSDFHGLRVTFCTMLDGLGASAREQQALARHASPILTASRYSKARPDRLGKLAEGLGAALGKGPDYAKGMQRLAAGAEGIDVTACDKQACQSLKMAGAGGLRPIPTENAASAQLPDRTPTTPGQVGALTGSCDAAESATVDNSRTTPGQVPSTSARPDNARGMQSVGVTHATWGHLPEADRAAVREILSKLPPEAGR